MAIRKNYRALRVLCACLLSLVAAGCATTSYDSTGEWQQPRSRDVPFQKVLVVTIVPDSSARRVFEKTVADAITDGGAWGVAAYSISGDTASTLNKDVVVGMAENSGADSVLVTKILDRAAQLAREREEALLHVGPTTKAVQSEDSSFTRSLTTNYAVELVPGSLVIEADAELESSLYEVATGYRLAYRATTRGHFEISGYDRMEQVANSFALTLVKRLRSDKVIR